VLIPTNPSERMRGFPRLLAACGGDEGEEAIAQGRGQRAELVPLMSLCR